MPRVFIGIPTINRPDYVKQAIRSVVLQTCRDWELVVSDNCSQPGVAEAITGYIGELNDDRISFHRQPENVGEYGQGRYFIGRADGNEYFMILHDDDLLSPDYLDCAVARLDQEPRSQLFLADAYVIDENGAVNTDETRKYLRQHGRFRVPAGEFSVPEVLLKYGFTPISGTLFRLQSLRFSGFVSENGTGNYPFELDVFLRIADHDARGWYQKEKLLSFRFHSSSMRNYIKLMDNEKVVDAMIHLFSTRAYDGQIERRRRVILGRLYRAKALIAARLNRPNECRKLIRMCFHYNLFSVKLWLIAPLALTIPWTLPLILPDLPTTREAPLLKGKS